MHPKLAFVEINKNISSTATFNGSTAASISSLVTPPANQTIPPSQTPISSHTTSTTKTPDVSSCLPSSTSILPLSPSSLSSINQTPLLLPHHHLTLDLLTSDSNTSPTTDSFTIDSNKTPTVDFSSPLDQISSLLIKFPLSSTNQTQPHCPPSPTSDQKTTRSACQKRTHLPTISTNPLYKQTPTTYLYCQRRWPTRKSAHRWWC